MLKKSQATELKYKKALIKLQSNSSQQSNLTPGVMQLKCNVQPAWANQIITMYLTGQFEPVKWYNNIISLSEMISYHFTHIIFIHGFIRLISTHNM